MKNLLTVISLFVFSLYCNVKGYAQSNGDYRSINTGTFSNLSIWEIYNSSNGNWELALSAPTGATHITIQTGDTVSLDGNIVMSSAKNFTVNGVVICSTYYIQGATGCTFTLAANSTLSTANANGILSTNIATVRSFSTNSFNSAANYIFNGSTNQTINASNTTFNNLTIQTSGGATVSLTAGQLLTLNGTLTLTSGLFNMSGSLTLSGPPIAGTSTNLITNNNSSLRFVTSQTGQFIPSSVTSIGNLYVDAGANALVAVNSNLSIVNSQGLNLVNGILNCGSFTISVSSNGAAGGNTGSYVKGTLLISLPFTTNAMFYAFPVGGATFNPLYITLAASLTTNTTLGVSVIDGIPVGTENMTSLSGGMSDRYWRLKMTGVFNISEVSSIQVGTLGISPSINSNSAIAFSTNNAALSYHSLGGIVGTNIISSGTGLSAAQFTDLASGDGSFVGISNKISLTPGIYCIGPSASYTPPSGTPYLNGSSPYSNLTAAILDLNTRGTTGHIVFELQNNYVSTTENNSMAITYQGTENATATFKVRNDLTIPLLISKTTLATIGVLDFNGGDYITFDGTINNAACGASYGIILRGLGSTCVSLQNDAQHNTLKGIQIEIGGTRGIYIEYNNGSVGNDYNSFLCNKFQLRSDIVSTASVNAFTTGVNSFFNCKNDNILIDQNKFENCANGIQVSGGGNNGLWTITNNHFYKTTASSAINSFINVQMTDTGKVIIEGNYFGGSAPFCAGSKMLISSSNSLFNLSLSSTSLINSSFSNNTIQNITSTSNLTLTQFGTLPLNIENNIVGNPSVLNDVTVGAQFGFIGYSGYSGSNTINIKGNTVSNISIPNNNGNSCTLLSFTSTGNQVKNISNNTFKNITTGNSAFYGISIGTSNGGGNVSYNVLENIHQTNNTSTVVNPISINGPNLNVVGNRIGHLSNANDIEFENIVNDVFYVFSTGNSQVDSNIIANVNLNHTGLVSTKVINYNSSVGSVKPITNNIIKDIKTKSTKTNAESDLANTSLIGLYLNIQFIVNASDNKIEGLQSTANTAISAGVIGIYLSSNTSSTISNNTMYNLRNAASGSSPVLIGILNSGTSSLIKNNMISISNGSNTNGVKIFGIRLAGFVGSRNIYHNSVSVSGNSAGVLNSYAFYKENNNSNTDILKNNIFSNVRTGLGNHFAIAHASGVTNQWATCDYNNLYSANANTLGEWPLGTSKTFATWLSTSTKDVNSHNLLVNFMDVNSNLHVNPSASCNLDSLGTNTIVTTDIDNQLRNANFPDVGADEFDNSLYNNAGIDQIICRDSTLLAASLDAGSAGFWTCSGCTFTPDSTSPTAIVHGLLVGTNTLVWHVSNASCSATDTLLIQVGVAPPPITTNYTQAICPGTEIYFELGAPLQSGAWSTGDTSKKIIVYPTVTATYSVNGTDINGCTVNFSQLATVINLPSIIPATPAQPTNNFNQVITPLTLSWAPAQHADVVELYAWPSNQSRPSIGENTFLNASKIYNTLLAQQEYYWQLKSYTICDTVWSDTSSFVTNYPDLQVQSVAVPNEIYTNTLLNITWKIKNLSSTANTGGKVWQDKVWLSQDSIPGNGVDVLLGTYANQSYLNAGDVYTQQRSIQVPNTLSGFYYILVEADFADAVPEVNQNNNLGYDTIQIIQAPLPDLKVISIGSPTNAFAGDSITVTYTIENDGQISTDSLTWEDEIFISNLPIFNADSAISLGKFSSKNANLIPVYYFSPSQGLYIDHYNTLAFGLPIDSTYTAQSKVMIPSLFWSGNYFIYVKTNTANEVFEGPYQSNNITKSTVTLSVTQMPPSDLVVDSIFVPTTANSGMPVTISWRVKNQGAAVTNQSNWTDKVYYNTTNSMIGATLLGTKLRQSTLATNASYISSLTATLPNGISGNYFFMVKTDEPNAVFEYTLENNNLTIADSTVQVNLSPSPDLKVTQANLVIDTMISSSSAQLNCIIKNIGLAATSGIFNIIIQYSDSTTYNGANSILAQINQNLALQPGDSIIRTINFTAPSTSGLHYVYVKADGANTQYEHNAEGNNVSVPMSLLCLAPPPTYSNLMIDSLSIPLNVMSGEQNPIAFRIKNEGPHNTTASSWTDRCYLSADTVLSLDDINVFSKEHIGSLDYEQSYTVNGFLTIPNGTPTGNYFLILRIDKEVNNQNDSVQTDNFAFVQISNTLTPAPDLEVLTISFPDTLYAKQSLWVYYTVRNNGPGVINSKDISDRIYFGTNTSSLTTTIGGIKKSRSIASGATYSDSIYVVLPAYGFAYNYFNLKTDNLNIIYENPNENNNVFSKSVYVEQSSGVDLIPISLNFPKDSFLLGEQVTANYALKNTGTKSLTANSRNAIHFSADTIFNGGTDYLLNYKDETTLIAPGDTLYRSMNGIVKDASPNTYNGILRLNTTATYPEATIANNNLVEENIHIDAEEITINTAYLKHLKFGDYLYYKLTAPANQDMVVNVKKLNGAGQNTIMACYTIVPNADNAQFIADDATKANQTLLVPGTQAGTYYLLIQNKIPSIDSQLIEIKAELLPLTILSIDNNECGQGIVTTTLKGASFRDTSTVQLRQGNTVFATATIVDYKHSMQMDIRWDFTNVPIGVYDVVIKNGGDSAVLANGMEVEVAEQLEVDITEFESGSFVLKQPYMVGYIFTNITNVDIPVTQINIFTSEDSMNVFNSSNVILIKDLLNNIPDTTLPTYKNIDNYSLISGYVKNLRPGESATISIKAKVVGKLSEPIELVAAALGQSREIFTRELLNTYEEVRQYFLNTFLSSEPELFNIFINKREYYISALSSYLNHNIITVADIDSILGDSNYPLIDFDPGESIGTLIDGEMDFKSNGSYNWEINVPTAELGGQPGNSFGWDFIKSVSNINVLADSIDKFEIVIIPRNPCNNEYTTLTSWEPWHDYKWAIAHAEGNVIGFNSNKFEIDTSLFTDVNNLYGGHFEISLGNDTIYLEFKHKERVCGETACNGGPGICGYPGGKGGPGICGGRGGDGGRGWGIGSNGGDGGDGDAGGGSGGMGVSGATNGAKGIDTNNDNDGDGLTDSLDNCPNTANPSQINQDGDFWGDACDSHPNQADMDTDGDGISDIDDNAPEIANSSQSDFDEDGIGDSNDPQVNIVDCISELTCPGKLDCPGGEGCDNPSNNIPGCSTCPGKGLDEKDEAFMNEDPNTLLNKYKRSCVNVVTQCAPDTRKALFHLADTYNGFSNSTVEEDKAFASVLDLWLTQCIFGQMNNCTKEIGIIIDKNSKPCISTAKQFLKIVYLEKKKQDGNVAQVADNSLNGLYVACILYKKPKKKITFKTLRKLAPVDPNEINGPEGVGDTTTRWVSKSETYPYSIHFENDSLLATAPASRVTITQDIHPNMDPLSFRLGSIYFQNQTFDLPENLSNYTGVINLNDSLGYDVQVTAGLDIGNNKLFWVLQSIDPLTGLPPNTINGGFLPVNDSLGNGQGYVSYIIKAKSSTQTLDTITAKANIVFDVNDPIETNTWKNTIDAGNPLSSIDTLPALILNNELELYINSADDSSGSGVYYTGLYYQINGGPFNLYDNYTDTSSILFTGIEGNIYGFYSIAVDSTGNREPIKTTAQWTVQFGYKDSIEIISPAALASYCEQSIIPFTWSKYKVDDMRLKVQKMDGTVLFTSPVFSSSDSVYTWMLPITASDSLLATLFDADNEYTFDQDTILVNHQVPWHLDADSDGYSIGNVINACVSPGFGYTTTITSSGDCNDADSNIHPNRPEICCNNIDDNCNDLVDEANITLKLFIEGYFTGMGTMVPCLLNQGFLTGNTICDTIEIELHDPLDYSLVFSTKAVLNTNGFAIAGFQNLDSNYYLAVKHRNGLCTWSANPIAIIENTYYDFTTSANQAYGNNQVEVETGVFAFYSGDINQDENMDLLDASLLEASIANFDFGYFATDLNGDGNVDLLDSPMLEANVNAFIFSNHP
ncbi:MAG: thrombospondin type 3 repeat-containing protein [Bacteroidetes bacterium]|nr:thrombospondin type 3 repeat-containing protein [Bacteroidota bacterium]